MRKSIIVLAFILTACTPTTPPDSVKVGAQEGGFCGGIAALPCAEGLTCKLDGDYPDAGGTCVKE